jgi:hypothetical protein
MGRHTRNKQVKENVAIVGDGQTERIYFSDVRDTDRPNNLTIFPDYPRRLGSYSGVLERALQLIADYDKVFALIDMDKIIQENRLAVYQRDKAAATAKGIIVLENNPCFEIWLLLHFEYTGRLFASCLEVEQRLNHPDRIRDYSKEQRFQAARRLYYHYKERLTNNAIPNAARLEIARADHDPQYPRAEIFKFFEWYFKR